MGNVLLNRMIAWSLLIVAGLAAVAGIKPIFNLYDKFSWYDEAVHFFFFFSITLVLSLYAYGAFLTGRHRHEILLVLTIAGLGLALGTIWQMIEWAYDLGHRSQLDPRLVGYDDRLEHRLRRERTLRNPKRNNGEQVEAPQSRIIEEVLLDYSGRAQRAKCL